MDTLEQPVVSPSSGSGAADVWEPRRRRSSSGPVAVRIFLGLLSALAVLLVVALMLSDRAPGAVRAVFGDTARSLWNRIDADRRTSLADAGLAEPDFLVHIGAWATVTCLVALTVWSWRRLAVVAIGVAVTSIAVELGQRRWASTRAFEASDVVGNLAGVAVGIIVAAAVIGGWALATDLGGRIRRRL